MKKFLILVIISLIGLGFAIYEAIMYEFPTKGSGNPLPIFKPPFQNYVAALGIIEPSSKPISVGVRVSGIVKKVFVKEGDSVKKGEPLFSLDDSDLLHKIALQKENIQVAKTNLKRYEDIYKITKDLWENAKGAISKKTYILAKDNYLSAKEKLLYEIKKLQILKQKQKYYLIQSPIDGIVLKNRIYPGMYIKASTLPYLIVGSNGFKLYAQVDELLAYKIQKGAKAVAYVRGEPSKKIELTFDYIRPFIEQKKLFLHLPLESGNTKALQVVYKVKNAHFPLYAGEIFDVYIETP